MMIFNISFASFVTNTIMRVYAQLSFRGFPHIYNELQCFVNQSICNPSTMINAFPFVEQMFLSRMQNANANVHMCQALLHSPNRMVSADSRVIIINYKL